MEITPQHALIVVDVQNDFCTGSLAVKGANEIIDVINKLINRISVCVFTRDYHPSNHCSFSETPEFIDKSWPSHCVESTDGVKYHPDLNIPLDLVGNIIEIRKGQSADKEEYSGFDNPELMNFLNDKPEITKLFIVGLATDYCVCETAKAAVDNGFETVVIDDACKAVDVPAGSVAGKYTEMRKKGVKFVNSREIANLNSA